MVKKWISPLLCVCGIILLAACDLQPVTPPVETATQTASSFIATLTEVPTETVVPTPVAVEISSKNVETLTVVNRSPATSAQMLKFSTDGASLVMSTQTTDSTGAQIFGATTLSVPELQPTNIYSDQSARVADISADGKLIALIALDMTNFSIVDISAGNGLVMQMTPGYLINNVTFAPDNSSVAVSKAESWEVVLYSLVDGSEIRTLSGFETAAPVYNAGFTQSPQWLVWHARATLQLQEFESGVLGPSMSHEDFVTAYAMSKDGSMLASIAASTVGDAVVPSITLWDASEGTQLKTLALTASAQCLDFSPNGLLLAAGVGNALQVWDVSSGTLLVSIEEHSDLIGALAFSADGKYIATAGQDNQLFLWRVYE